MGTITTHGFTSDHRGPRSQIIMEILPIMSTINFCSCWTEVARNNCSHHGNNFDDSSSPKLVTIMVTGRQTDRFVSICAALEKTCPNLGRVFKAVILNFPTTCREVAASQIIPKFWIIISLTSAQLERKLLQKVWPTWPDFSGSLCRNLRQSWPVFFQCHNSGHHGQIFP